MKQPDKDARVLLVGAILVTMVFRDLDAGLSFLRWAAEDSRTAQKADQSDDDFFCRVHPAQVEAVGCHAGKADDGQGEQQPGDMRRFSVCALNGFNDCRCYRLERRPDFFPRNQLARCSWWGRFRRGVVVAHSRVLSRLKLWNSDRKGGRA